MVCYKPYSTHKQQQVYAHGLACKVCTTGKAQSHIHTASLSLIIHHTRRNAHTDYKTFTKGAVLDSSALKYKGIFKNFDQTSFKKRPKKAQTANPKIVRPTNLKTANLATLGGKYDCRSYWYCYCKCNSKVTTSSCLTWSPCTKLMQKYFSVEFVSAKWKSHFTVTNRKNVQILQIGQMCFFMASALQNWLNFSNLVPTRLAYFRCTFSASQNSTQQSCARMCLTTS